MGQCLCASGRPQLQSQRGKGRPEEPAAPPGFPRGAGGHGLEEAVRNREKVQIFFLDPWPAEERALGERAGKAVLWREGEEEPAPGEIGGLGSSTGCGAGGPGQETGESQVARGKG